MIFRPKTGILAENDNRQLIRRVLRENFHLYIPRYLLSFLLMCGVAAATGLSAFLMKNITVVVFGSPGPLKSAPSIDHSHLFGQKWIPNGGELMASFFNFSSPGLLPILNVSLAA